ncbi:MAG TPA: hypothetical protein VGR41_09460 [Actinomycetota bacterium]|jgi:hypothetical protein|nr:hypothetical protein [Actinomycetota bacterium]
MYAYVMDQPGATMDLYRAVRQEVGEDAPPGLIVHAVGLHDDGVPVIDVWESKGDCDRFDNERFYPAQERAFAKVGSPPGMPVLVELDVQAFMRP